MIFGKKTKFFYIKFYICTKNKSTHSYISLIVIIKRGFLMKRRNTKITALCLTVVFLFAVGSISTIGTTPEKQTLCIAELRNPSKPMQLPSPDQLTPNSPAPQTKQPIPPYIIIDLSEATDPLGVNISEAVGINNHGEIVGYETLDDFLYRTIYWSPDGTATLLETLEGTNSSRPYMIDDNGLILGWSGLVWYRWIGEFKELHMNQTAVLWENHEIQNLNNYVTGGDILDLYHTRDNNLAGTIVGSGAPPGHIPPPWWPNGFILDNGSITDLGTATYPYAINNHGDIAGWIEADFTHAHVWEEGIPYDLNDDPLIQANYSQAYDINDHGLITGMAQYDYSLYWEPTVWKNHKAIRLLPTTSLYAGYAIAVNEKDQVIGYYDDLMTGAWCAFLWEDNQIVYLNDYLGGTDWEWIYPEDINDKGQIVGLGYKTEEGFRAFLMTPAIPELDIMVEDGKGLTVFISNSGYAPATNLSWAITIDGGFIFKGKQTTGLIDTIAIDEIATITSNPKGIGLGFFLPLPRITIEASCTEGVSVNKTLQAKILFSTVTIQ